MKIFITLDGLMDFLGALRPYAGKLDDSNFHEIIMCMRVLSKEFAVSDLLDKHVISDIQAIIHFGRAWAVYENGMLRENNLIEEDDWRKIEEWIEIISYSFAFMLDTDDERVIFETYDEYLKDNTT